MMLDVQWQEWSLAIKNIVVPMFCRSCGVRLLTEENGAFCPTCWDGSPHIERPFCTICGRPHSGATGFATRSNFPCAECREAPIPHLRRMWGAARYDGPVAEAVQLLKFHGKRRLARPLAERMAAFAADEIDMDDFDCLMPVPLHRVRRRARGFNQSLLIAHELAPLVQLPVLDGMTRLRPTRVQSLLDDHERAANIVGAFGVSAGVSVQGRRVLVIDDVVTTGNTVSECAAALRRAGAVDVCVLAAALAVRKNA